LAKTKEKIVEPYSSCKGVGCKPKCALGCLTENKQVELKGIPFDIFYNYQTTKRGWAPANRGSAVGRTYDVVILLEGITEEEDKRNLPIAGSLADRLMNCIAQAGFASSQVYITSMVKCAPPKGRKASLTESKACLVHFRHELENAQPKVVMLVGSTTMRAFNLHNEGGIFKNRGKVFNVKLPDWEDGPTFKVIPTFHPSMFFYKNDPVAEQRMFDDYILAADMVRGDAVKVAKPKNKFRLIKTTKQFNEMIAEMKEAPLVAFDTESRSLPAHREPMLMMSFCWGYDRPGEQTAVLPIYHHSPTPNALGWHVEPFWGTSKHRAPLDYLFSELKTHIFENEKIVKAAHNLKYDWHVIRKWVGSDLKGTLYDTMLLHHLIREQKPHDLKYLADLEFAIGSYNSKVEDIGHAKGYDCIPHHIFCPYAAIDAENVFRLACVYNFKILERVMDKNPQLYSLYIDRVQPALEALVDVEDDGIQMDKDLTIQYKADYEKEQARLLSSLKAKTCNPEFNPLSTVDVRNAAIKDGHSDAISDLSKSSGWSTGKEVLLDLSQKWPIAANILQYRTNRKMISTYLESALTELDPDGRIRKSFMLHGTESGRLSCSFLHQVPKATKSGIHNLRDLFVAGKDCLFGYMDYKQIELKVYAVLIYLLTGDHRLVDIFFDPKSDAHRTMAAILLEIPEDLVSPLNRDVGKTFNFGAIFGSSGYDLVGKEYEGLKGQKYSMTWDTVNMGINRFHNMYPSVREYMALIPDLTRKQDNTFISVMGRERHMGDALNSRDPKKRGKAERELVNFTVQSPAAQITIDTMSIIHRQIKKFREQGQLKKSHVRIVNTVHDSLMTEFHAKLQAWTLSLMKTTAERPIPELGGRIFTVDLGIGKTWAEAESKTNKVTEV